MTTTTQLRGGSSDMIETLTVDEVCSQYYLYVYKYLRHLVHNHELAEDLTQETFYKAIRAFSRLSQEQHHYGGWLKTIAFHVFTDASRKWKQRMEHGEYYSFEAYMENYEQEELAIADPRNGDPYEFVPEREARRALTRRVWALMPDYHRAAFVDFVHERLDDPNRLYDARRYYRQTMQRLQEQEANPGRKRGRRKLARPLQHWTEVSG